MSEKGLEQPVFSHDAVQQTAPVLSLSSEHARRFVAGLETVSLDYMDALRSIDTLVRMVSAMVAPYVKIAGETGLHVKEVVGGDDIVATRVRRSFGNGLDKQFNDDAMKCTRELVGPFVASVERNDSEWGHCFGRVFVADLVTDCQRFMSEVEAGSDDVLSFFRNLLIFRRSMRDMLKAGAFRGELIEMDVASVDVDVLVADGADMYTDLRRKAGVILRNLSLGLLGVERLRKRITDLSKMDDLMTVLRLMNQLFSENRVFDRRKFDAIAALEQCFGEIYGDLFESGELESVEGQAITTMFDAYVRGLARYKNICLQDVNRQKLVDDLHRIIGKMKGFDLSLGSLSRRSFEAGDEQAERTLVVLRSALMEFGILEDIVRHFPMRDLRALQSAFLVASSAWAEGDVEGFKRAIDPLRSCIDGLDIDFAELIRQGYFPQPSFMKAAEVPDGGYEEL